MKDKLLSLLNTKTKKISAAIITLAVIVATGFGVYALYKEKEIVLSLKEDKRTVTIEYGSTIEPSIEDYLNTSKLDQETKKKVLKETKLESTLKNEDGKEYPGIGNYVITITYKDKKLESKVEVKDTTVPVFNETNEISFEEGTEFDYASVISATDLQEVEITFDTSNVNKDIVGEYTVKAVAKDKSGNEATKDIKVIVTEKSVAEETPTTNTGGSNAGNGTTNKPSSSGSVVNKPSNNGNSSSTQSQPESQHVHADDNYVWDGYWFSDDLQAEEAAERYITTQAEGQFIYNRYGLIYCTCGKVGVVFYK